MNRLIFPCGAYFPVSHDDELLEAAHRAKDGAYRIGVYPSSQPYATDQTRHDVKTRWKYELKGDRAPCLGVCPNRSRRTEQRGYDAAGQLGVYISCHARLWDKFDLDVTPPAPAKCPHCEEQRAYVAECKRAAKIGGEAPAREKWRKCPSCNTYCEMFEGSGRCASCQLVKVVEANRA